MALRDHLRLDRLVLGHRAVHHPRDGARREEAQQLVFEREVEATLAGIALATRTAAQLIVDAPRVVALGAEHVETPGRTHLVALALGDRAPLGERLLVGRVVLFGARRQTLTDGVSRGETLGVAAEDDVDAATGHVGRDGDRALAARLGHDLGLAEVLLRVQDLVGEAGLREFAREQLGLLDRRGAEQDGLATVGPLATSSTIAANFASSVL